MKIIKKPSELKKIALKHQKARDQIGIVPTMGALHEGHISLIEQSCRNDDITIVSIFVNPTQFGPNEDYLKYPRPFDKDLAVCKASHVDYVFAPSVKDMFGADHKTFIEVFDMQDILCGATRKGHFRGVATVVAKLFNLSMADNAYFGMKDFQQLRLIEKMVKELNFAVKVIGCPIVREKSGIALSSRNTYLTASQKEDACLISKTLKAAAVDFAKGIDVSEILEKSTAVFDQIPQCKVEYAQIVDFYDLTPIEPDDKKAVFLVAVRVGGVRLIDNIILARKHSK
ncbi:MAG: pantoate--beta-alanine ligase [Elusimicrobiota bacterium]|jgi:pantoate--beta-alanine ligase|nr:pantoate--beta-alanine ligase [Elusimicrobiota bacterium]